MKSRGEKLKHLAGALFGAVLCSALLPGASNYVVVWAAHWVAADRFAASYQALDVKGLSNVFEVTMASLPNGQEVRVRQTREHLDRGQWRVGDHVCVRGRTSLFGAIAESIERDNGNCIG